jgi:hypothetical protein
VLALLLTAGASAQESPLAGDWIGKLEVPAARQAIVLHVTRQDDGSLKGTLDSPDDGLKGAPLEEIRLDLNLVRFRSKAMDATYAGRLNGDLIAGTLRQHGFSLKLNFQRAVDAGPSRRHTTGKQRESKPAGEGSSL